MKHHFDWLTDDQLGQMEAFVKILLATNEQINLISRKDTDQIWTHHILHSLSIAKVIRFADDNYIADVGTGGGLPGIPLAIAFPSCKFTLIDSIGKKIAAINEMNSHLGLKNVTTVNDRMENIPQRFDFVVSRAVSSLPAMQGWLKGKIIKGKSGPIANGLIYIKGGDFETELKEIKRVSRVWNISEMFDDPFFETKKVVWLDLAS